MSKLQDSGLWDNTLLVFVSDNGGPIYEPGAANNYPRRGGKYNDFSRWCEYECICNWWFCAGGRTSS